MLDQRGQLLRAAVGFSGCSMLSYDAHSGSCCGRISCARRGAISLPRGPDSGLVRPPARVRALSTLACRPTHVRTRHASAEVGGLPTGASDQAGHGSTASVRAGFGEARTGEQRRSTGRCIPDPHTSHTCPRVRAQVRMFTITKVDGSKWIVTCSRWRVRVGWCLSGG